MSEQSEWVSLGEAASLLGVHPSTVRHWADSGDLASQRTPGGHRRFRRSDLEQWLTARHSETTPTEAQLVMQSALGRARLEISDGQLEGLSWYDKLDADARRAHGSLGRKLIEVFTSYLTDLDSQAMFLREVHKMGEDYARLSLDQGLTISESVQAFLFFRDLLVESVIQMAEMLSLNTPSEWARRLTQVNRLTDELLLSMIEAYEPEET